MKRLLPPEVDRLKNWCLKEKRFEDADFVIDIKRIMETGQKLNANQAERLGKLLSHYVLDVDLEEKIKERRSWWKR